MGDMGDNADEKKPDWIELTGTLSQTLVNVLALVGIGGSAALVLVWNYFGPLPFALFLCGILSLVFGVFLILRTKKAERAVRAQKKQAESEDRSKTINEAGRQFPSVAAALIERSEYEIAKNAANESTNRVLVIYGPSGTGKTQLALNVLQNLVPGPSDQKIDEDYVAFIDCAQIGFDGVFVRCLQRLSRDKEAWKEIEDSI